MSISNETEKNSPQDTQLSVDKNTSGKSYIKLPSSIFLTKEGVNALQGAGLAIQTIKDKDRFTRNGLITEGFNAPVVQKMIMRSMINEIAVSLPDLLTHRFEIISVNSLILYAVLYKKLSPALAEKLFQSEFVKDYNRKNPKGSLVSLNNISRIRARSLKNSFRSEFERNEKSLRQAVVDLIFLNQKLDDTDVAERIRSLDKFIRWVDERIWYLFFILNRTKAGPRFMADFASLFAVYLENTSIAAHSGNLLMEFIQNAEKAHFTRLVTNFSIEPVLDIDFYLRKKENRQKVISLAERTGELLDVSWTVQHSGARGNNSIRLVTTITNFGLIDEVQKKNIQKKMNTSVEGMALADFYKEDPFKNPSALGAGLGLLYNSYLEDYCRSRGIYYKSSVSPEPSREKTTVRIEMIL